MRLKFTGITEYYGVPPTFSFRIVPEQGLDRLPEVNIASIAYPWPSSHSRFDVCKWIEQQEWPNDSVLDGYWF